MILKKDEGKLSSPVLDKSNMTAEQKMKREEELETMAMVQKNSTTLANLKSNESKKVVN